MTTYSAASGDQGLPAPREIRDVVRSGLLQEVRKGRMRCAFVKGNNVGLPVFQHKAGEKTGSDHGRRKATGLTIACPNLSTKVSKGQHRVDRSPVLSNRVLTLLIFLVQFGVFTHLLYVHLMNQTESRIMGP